MRIKSSKAVIFSVYYILTFEYVIAKPLESPNASSFIFNAFLNDDKTPLCPLNLTFTLAVLASALSHIIQYP